MPGEWDTYETPEESMRRLEERASVGESASTGRGASTGGRKSGAWIVGAAAAVVVLGGGIATLAATTGGDDADAVDLAEVYESEVLEVEVLGKALDEAAAEAETYGAAPYEAYIRHDVISIQMVDEDAGLVRMYQEVDFDDDGYRMVVNDDYDDEADYEQVDLDAIDPEILIGLIEHALSRVEEPTGFHVLIGQTTFDEGDLIVKAWAEEPAYVLADLDGTILREERGEMSR